MTTHHHTHSCHNVACSEHHHHHSVLREKIALIAATIVLLAIAMSIEHWLHLPTWQLLLIYLVPYLVIGHDTLKEAAEGLAHGDAFNEHFLMSIATLGALAIGFLPGAETQFPEAVAVMLLFEIGKLFEDYAEGKSRDSIAHLMDIRPDVAHVVRNGATLDISPEEVAVGETIIIKPGEKVPLDGIVTEGRSTLNTMALTGESVPHDIAPDDEVISGCVNLSGVVKARVTNAYSESTVAKILELVEHAADNKSQSETFIRKFARVYTPVVVFAAIAVAVLPPLLSGDFLGMLPRWLYSALMFLVVSCPCALVISVPLTFFGGIGGASRRGILIKGGNFIDSLARVNTIVFDKTGTLTQGQFTVTAVHPETCDEHHLLHLAAHVEHYSTHPIGAALRASFPNEATDGCQVSDVEEVAGRGIKARVGDDEVWVGNSAMMDDAGVKWHECTHFGSIIHVAINGVYAGHIVINDSLKTDSAAAIAQLATIGIRRTVMLTGDTEDVAQHIAKQLNINEYHAQLLPTDKVALLEQLLGNSTESHTVAFVGDGINDAPALAQAHIGIAMGALGSEAAIEAADVVIMDDRPSKIALAVNIARRTIAIARQNAGTAIVIKLGVMVLAVMGLATLWMAVFADVGVTILAVLNAMRAMHTTRLYGQQN